jgi:hypothetical protein
MDVPKGMIKPEYRLKEDSVYWENGPTVDQETAEATKLLKEILSRRSRQEGENHAHQRRKRAPDSSAFRQRDGRSI